MEADNVEVFEEFEDIEEEVNEKVEKKFEKAFKKPKVSIKKVEKTVIELKSDKGTFNLEETRNRCEVRYTAKLVSDNSSEAIFENDSTIIKIKKV